MSYSIMLDAVMAVVTPELSITAAGKRMTPYL